MMARIALAAFSMVLVTCFVVQDEETKSSQKQDKIVVPGEGEEAMSRRDFMRSKLMHSQNVLHGLTTGNFSLINAGIDNMAQITEASNWVDVDDDRYRKLTSDFQTAVERLAAAAKTKNIEATALRYYQLSTSCIDCHQHIRIAKYQFQP